jgi:hypothetical protein
MTVPTIIIFKLRIADSRLSFIPKRYPANQEKNTRDEEYFGSRTLIRAALSRLDASRRMKSDELSLRSRIRWVRLKLIADRFVDFNGKPVASVKKGFKSAVGLAGLSGKVRPTPCVIRRRPGSCSVVYPCGRRLAFSARRPKCYWGPMATIIPTSCTVTQMPLLPGTGFSVAETMVDLESARERRQKA